MTITVDSVSYNVRLPYPGMQRSFELVSGRNAGTMVNQRIERDIVGTRYSYSLQIEPDPAHRADYDSLFQVLSAPVAYHEITVPYGQTTMTFNAAVSGGSDNYQGMIGTEKVWKGMTIQFTPIEPQRRS